jgi:hypothetical protein
MKTIHRVASNEWIKSPAGQKALLQAATNPAKALRLAFAAGANWQSRKVIAALKTASVPLK